MSKELTIDDMLIKNGITHLTGKEHDGVIATVIEYLMQEQHKSTNITQEDLAHLNWMYARLISVHGENQNYDYMLRMNKILTKIANNL
jgi:iron-sulfur cluster repair protein YtfE (RIC family)